MSGHGQAEYEARFATARLPAIEQNICFAKIRVLLWPDMWDPWHIGGEGHSSADDFVARVFRQFREFDREFVERQA